MSQCSKCGKVYKEPEDEQGDHPCPKCGYEWWEDHEEEQPYTSSHYRKKVKE